MPQIHMPGSRHGCGGDPRLCGPDGFPLPHLRNERMYYWNPYVAGSLQHTTLLAAMRWIEDNLVATNGPARQTCDADFASFGHHIPFSERWRDPAIWISYNPTPTVTEYGAVLGGTLDITISQNAFARGLRHVAGTIIHEFAHINNAGDGRRAEQTLLQCGCADVYDPNIVGSLRLPPRPSIRRV